MAIFNYDNNIFICVIINRIDRIYIKFINLNFYWFLSWKPINN